MSDDGLDLLRQRCADLPSVLRATLAAPLPSLSALAHRTRWIITGAGASEGPARLFAALLRRHLHVCAAFVPLSAFAPGRAADVTDPSAVLVVISQGVAPNARLALARAPSFAACVVVTAAPDHSSLADIRALGGFVVGHPPRDESGLLLRVQGPAAATMALLRMIDALSLARGDAPPFEGHLDAIPDGLPDEDIALDERSAALAASGQVAFVSCDPGLELAHGLRWKWLEGPATCDPPCWDSLQMVHGPLQHVLERPRLLLALEPDNDSGASALLDRLATVVGDGQPMLRLRARTAGVTGFFDFDARCNRLVCAVLARCPRDLVHWPGFGHDAALYDLGAADRGPG
jgi:fructoselysine-6-P-deglycase FrlB-like protein